MFFLCLPICLYTQLPLQSESCYEKYARLGGLFSRFTNEVDLREIVLESSALLESALVKEPFGNFIRDHLVSIRKEAEYVLSMEKTKKLLFLEKINKLRKLQDKSEKEIRNYSESEMGNLIEEIKKDSKCDSLIVYEAIIIKVCSDILVENTHGNKAAIDRVYSTYKGVFGEKNPELFRVIYLYITYFQINKEKDEFYKYCQKLKELIPKGYPGRFEILFYSDLFYLQFLVESKFSINDAFYYYKTIDKSKISDFNSLNIGSRCLYFRTCVAMFSDLNSTYNMIEMQENLVRALVFRYGNKTNAAVKTEAIILRDMLASQKETKLLKKIEAEFKLDALPD